MFKRKLFAYKIAYRLQGMNKYRSCMPVKRILYCSSFNTVVSLDNNDGLGQWPRTFLSRKPLQDSVRCANRGFVIMDHHHNWTTKFVPCDRLDTPKYIILGSNVSWKRYHEASRKHRYGVQTTTEFLTCSSLRNTQSAL